MSPTQAYGVYPAEGTAGDQVSSTFIGRHLTMQAQELTHAGAVVTKGMPVVFGVTFPGNAGVGIAFNTEVAVTDLIAIDTEGIWDVSVEAADDGGAMLVTGGDPLYINTTTCLVSKRRTNLTQIPFGYALGQVAAAAIAVIAVKLHWDPPSHWLLDQEALFFGDGAANNADMRLFFDGTDLVMLPIVSDGPEFAIGDGTTLLDQSWYGTAAGNYLRFDASANELINVGVAIRIPEDEVLEFGAPDHTLSWTGEEIEISGDRTTPGDGDYFRVLHAALTVGLDAGDHWGTISTYTTLSGGAGGATWAGAIVGTLEQLDKQVDGYLAAGIFEFKNSADACSTSGALWLSIKNQSAVGYGGVMHGFIVCQDTSPADRDTQCLFVLDSMDATTAASASEIVCQVGAANAASHVIKISANGVPYWIMMDSTPPA